MSTHFKLIRADGSERKVSGYKYAAPRPDSIKYAANKYQQAELPPKVDLRPYMTEVEDQKNTSSCVANAVAGAYEYLAKRHQGEIYDVSRLFIYYNARAAEGATEEDGGSFIHDAIEGLKEYGACSEETWPFDEELVLTEPEQEAYNEAANFLVESVELVPVDLYAWKHCLAEGYPIIFGISLYNSFDLHRKKGVVPVPSPNEASRASHGGHSMLCVGYSDKDRLFIVRNSWGSSWGDNGYCYIPYDYLVNKKFNDGDCWIIKQLDNFSFEADIWGDEESLVEELDSELAQMDEDTYAEMLEAMGDYHLEYRIALILLCAAAADGEISDEELEEISSYMSVILERLGSTINSTKLLKRCLKTIDDQALFDESIELLNTYLSKPMLAKILSEAQEIIGVDDLSQEEEDFIAALVEAWQIDEEPGEEQVEVEETEIEEVSEEVPEETIEEIIEEAIEEILEEVFEQEEVENTRPKRPRR